MRSRKFETWVLFLLGIHAPGVNKNHYYWLYASTFSCYCMNDFHLKNVFHSIDICLNSRPNLFFLSSFNHHHSACPACFIVSPSPARTFVLIFITNVRHINYCMHRVNLLRHHGIKPILVFDGGLLPMKSDQETKRSRYAKYLPNFKCIH